jgi:hypothetical protein
MCHDSAVAHDRAAGAPAEEIEITPEMIEAGEIFIDEEWGGRSRRFENLLPDFLAMMAASRPDERTCGDHISDA